MIYQVYMGSDVINSSVPPENKIGQFNSYDEALKQYRKCQKRCKEMCEEECYKYNRNYCYMIEINPNKKLYGYIKGMKIDNGYDSRTVMWNSYSAYPSIHNMSHNEEGYSKY